MLSSEEILDLLRKSFAELFEIDSIDAVDLIERVRRHIGRKVSPEDFRSVRTVGDLVQAIERLQRG